MANDVLFDPPADMVPASVAIAPLIATGITGAIAVGGFRVYPAGVEFLVELFQRSDDVPVESLRHAGERGSDEFSWDLLVRYRDGRAIALSESRVPAASRDIVLHRYSSHSHGSAGGRRDTSWLWLSPLPASGDVDVVVKWLYHGIGESAHSVNGQFLRDSADAAVHVWER